MSMTSDQWTPAQILCDIVFLKYLDSDGLSQSFLVKKKSDGNFYIVKACESTFDFVRRESKVLNMFDSEPGFQDIVSSFNTRNVDWIVTKLLGPSLHELFNICSDKFTLPTVLMFMKQAISRVAALHVKNLIHRNIKPAVFKVGVGLQSRTIFLTDFVLSYFYKDAENKFIDRGTQKAYNGTVEFSSIYVDDKKPCTRRDDMISIGYVAVYFLKGFLPWTQVDKDEPKRNETIMEIKRKTSIDQLCIGLPCEFAGYLDLCYKLGLYEEPPYPVLISLFSKLMSAAKINDDMHFDWILLKESLEAKHYLKST